MNQAELSHALLVARLKFPTGNLCVSMVVLERSGVVKGWVDVESCGTWARGNSLSEALDHLEAALSPETLDSAIKSAEVAVKNAQGELLALRAKRHALAFAQAERKGGQ
jgi:hypothetical protein